MKRLNTFLISAFAAALLAVPAFAAYTPPLEYGVAQTITFDLYNTDGTLDVDEVDGGTEVTLYCDEAAGATATNDFVDEGPYYSLALTATELQCARLVVSIGATDTNNIHIWTIGSASAQVDDDGGWYDAVPDPATILTRLGTPSNFGSGTSTIAANLEDLADDGTATYSRTTDSLQAIRDRGDAAWTTGSGTGLTAVASGTAQSATATTLVLASGETFADDELIGAVVQVTGGTTGVGQTRCIKDNVGSTDTITVTTWTTTPTGTITYEIAPSLGGECPLSTASSGATELNLTANGNIGIDWANVENFTTPIDFSGTTIGTVDALTGHTAQTGDNYARLGAPAGASVSADVAAVKGDTAATLIDTGTTLPGTLGTPAGADLAADVAAVKSDTAATLVDTGTTLPATLGTPAGADMAADIAAIVALLGIAEPGSVPNFSSDAGDVLAWLLALSRNEINQTSTTKTIRNDADSGNIATCAVSDDGTTMTRAECL